MLPVICGSAVVNPERGLPARQRCLADRNCWPDGQVNLRSIAFDAADDMWVCGSTPDAVYQRINGVWQTGINGPAGQTNLTGIAFDAAGDMWVCGQTPDGLPAPQRRLADWHCRTDGADFFKRHSLRRMPMICGSVGDTPDLVYQRVNGVWQTGIAGPTGQTILTGLRFEPPPPVVTDFLADAGDARMVG